VRRHVINQRQLDLLRRIADGGKPVTSDEPHLAITVYALRGRGLVSTRRRAGGWIAEISDAGRLFLGHGQHPDAITPPEPARIDEIPEPSITPRRVLEELRSGGGSLTVADPTWDTRAAWRRAVHALRASGLVPSNQALMDIEYRAEAHVEAGPAGGTLRRLPQLHVEKLGLPVAAFIQRMQGVREGPDQLVARRASEPHCPRHRF
jgi:hypothetical protein